jgi:uncharacterized protein RhaS with RHS repeats
MGERYYDSTLGRWTQQDPIVDVLDPKLWNRYVYVGNDPINYVDPSGLSWWSKAKCVASQLLPHKDYDFGSASLIGLGATIALAPMADGASAVLAAMRAGAAGVAAGGLLLITGAAIVALGIVLAARDCP